MAATVRLCRVIDNHMSRVLQFLFLLLASSAFEMNFAEPTTSTRGAMKNGRRNSFSAAEPSESAAYVTLNRQTACPPHAAVSVNQGCRRGSFTHDNQFAFDNGGDRPAMSGN